MSSYRNTIRYAVFGVVFGFLFPVGSTLMQVWVEFGTLSSSQLMETQATSPLLWVIDTAPLFLGLFAGMAGRRQDALAISLRQLRVAHAQLEQTNTAIAGANRELIEAGRLKSQFVANMSHELRTPLNAIIGFSRIVLRKTRDVIPERQARNLEMVHESGQHLLELVNDLLDVERIEAGMLKVSPTDVEVDELVHDVVAKLQPLAGDKGLELTAVVEDGPLRVRTDPVRVRQILDNLTNNAIKYSERGHIELRVSCSEAELRFAIRDEGGGIAEEEQESIFDAFHQIDGSATRAQGGVGLGLHLVRRLAELLGGRVELRSELGVGSTFSFVLPAEELVSDAVGAKGAPEAAGEGPLLLIIDDAVDAIEIMQGELVDQGFRVHAATSGAEGLEKAASLLPDAILLDMVMPEVDGWTVLKRLRASPELADIPVVVTSMLDEAPAAWDLGIVGWLTKPVGPDAFREVFERLDGDSRRDVLVVEDDAPTRSLILQSLRELEVSVRTAADGPGAVHAIDDRLPRAVVLDLMLPHLDGFEVLAHLRACPRGERVPVVVYTAKDLTPEERKRLNGGVTAVINKGMGERSMLGLAESVRRAMAVRVSSHPPRRRP